MQAHLWEPMQSRVYLKPDKVIYISLFLVGPEATTGCNEVHCNVEWTGL